MLERNEGLDPILDIRRMRRMNQSGEGFGQHFRIQRQRRKRKIVMNLATVSGRRFIGVFASFVLLIAGLAIAASFQVRPGDFITPDNAYKVEDLLPPSAYASRPLPQQSGRGG
jgi:hypothetical protein